MQLLVPPSHIVQPPFKLSKAIRARNGYGRNCPYNRHWQHPGHAFESNAPDADDHLAAGSIGALWLHVAHR